MRLTVNGRERDVDSGTDLVALLRSFAMDPRLVIVEHNGRIFRPDDFAGVDLSEGDRVEIVQFVGGG